MESNGARRARKRPILRVVLVLFALVAAWFSWEVYRALTAKPFIEIDYAAKMEELILSYHEDSSAPNGWPVFEEAMEIYENVVEVYDRNDDGPNGNLYLLIDTVYSSYSWTDTEDVTLEMVRDNAIDALAAMGQAGLYDKLDELLDVQTALRPTPAGLLMGLSDWSASRSIARACKARMFLAQQSGDSIEFVRAYKHCLAVAKVLGMQGEVIDGLVSVAIEAVAFDQLRTSLIQNQFDEATLKELAASMDRQLMDDIVKLNLEVDRIRLLDCLQASSTKDGRLLVTEATAYMAAQAGFGPPPPSLGEYQLSNLLSIALPRKDDIEDKIKEYFDGSINRMNTPFAQRTSMTFDPEVFVEELSIGYFLFKPMFGPPMLVDIWDQQVMLRRGTRLMIAIEIHKIRHGAYPTTLENLDRTILGEPPRDPYGTGTFGYRLMAEGEDEHNRPYLLYSVGRDMTDNGGATPKHGPHGSIAPDGTPGYDYELNHVSEEDE